MADKFERKIERRRNKSNPGGARTESKTHDNNWDNRLMADDQKAKPSTRKPTIGGERGKAAIPSIGQVLNGDVARGIGRVVDGATREFTGRNPARGPQPTLAAVKKRAQGKK